MQGIVYLRPTASVSGEPVLAGDEYCPDQAGHPNRRFQALAAKRLIGVGEILRTKEETAELWVLPEPEQVEDPADKDQEEDEDEENSGSEEEDDVEDDSDDEEDEADDEDSESEYTKTQVRKMSEDELQAVIEVQELEVDLTEHSSKKKKANAVIEALAEKDLI